MRKLVMQDLDHQIWKIFRDLQIPPRILVALSGGVDSVALTLVLQKILKKIPGSSLQAAYFHHGDTSDAEQNLYRERAALFCTEFCGQNKIPFKVLRASDLIDDDLFMSVKKEGEAEHRERRYEALTKHLQVQKLDILALGHHSDDLLETRLLRLIRGTGAQGLMAMEVFKAPLFRPFLETSKAELEEYLIAEKMGYCEDPSNFVAHAVGDPLRNWLRREWLVALETRQAGAVNSLARSLETLARELQAPVMGELLRKNAIHVSSESAGLKSSLVEGVTSLPLSRAFFLSLSLAEQKTLLAQYLLSLGKRDFSQGQLEEICKRLDNSQKMFRFNVAQCDWMINAEQIKVES